MSIALAEHATSVEKVESPATQQLAADRTIATAFEHLCDVLQNVSSAIAPVWPLKDYVAVNPYLGLSHLPFLKARRLLRSVSDCETLMPLSYYRQKFQAEEIHENDIKDAVDEINAQNSQARLSLSTILQLLQSSEALGGESANSRQMRTIAEFVDRSDGTDWSATIREEIGRHCAAHYDEGQATWESPWKHLPLYQAWRSAAQQDRRPELLGASGCRRLFAAMPHTAEAAVAFLLHELRIPEELWEKFLLCQAHSVPGWSSWTRYKTSQAVNCVENTDFIGLLAIRLAYDVAVSQAASLNVDWESLGRFWGATGRTSGGSYDDQGTTRFALLRASEIAWQRQLLASLEKTSFENADSSAAAEEQPLAQMVFCIDVRSERFRRNLEHVSDGVETFGFAGFFGMPIAIRNPGEAGQTSQVPALLSPSFTVEQGVRDATVEESTRFSQRRGTIRSLRKTWKQFQSSASGCFGFVETSGLAYGWKLLSKSLSRESSTNDSRYDGIPACDSHKLGPIVSTLETQGVDQEQQLDLAESALRGIGLTQNFGKLVVFCGHGSQTQNNPLQAGLDCGACCGHSGEPNARFAATLLNQAEIRDGLRQRGIDVPDESRFIAAMHDTTSDQVRFFDTGVLSESQRESLRHLAKFTTDATAQTQMERLPQLRANNVKDVLRRTLDWSEVRPEWGLAGNAAFIVAPRDATQKINMQGRSFLHSYDYRNDEDFKVLEQIMTAPMVVGHWINMQYYASTVDNRHYGSGSKTIHNVVGKFGIFSGNGGDLTTGLAWQSVHNGESYQHEPLRLLAVIAAPKDAVADIIERNKVVEDLLTNNWLNLVVLDDGEFHRYTTKQSWAAISKTQVSPPEPTFN